MGRSIPLKLPRGKDLLTLAVRFVDREIFVARRTESIEDPRFFDGLDTMRNIGGEIKGIPRLHFVRCSTDNQFHSPRQNVDDLLVRVLVRRHLAASIPHGVETIEETRVLDTFSPPRDEYLAIDEANRQRV